MIITITGTPGTGKTFLAKRMAKNLGFDYMDLNKYIKRHKLYSSYDRKDRTFDVDIQDISKKIYAEAGLSRYASRSKNSAQLINSKRLLESMLQSRSVKDMLSLKKKIIGKHIIIDSHMSHYLPSDLCIVVSCDIKKLSLRLKKRGYLKNKIRDNIESEIFQICFEEAKALNRSVLVLET